MILFAHTADDVAEAELMRTEGSTLGRLRDWSPSPVWPEGRGLKLLRPMLDVSRRDLRGWLAGQGLGWIDDPANDDFRFARPRARRTLSATGQGSVQPPPPCPASPGPFPTAVHQGVFIADRVISAHALAVLLVCAGGGDRPPRGDRLDRILTRLRAGETFTATLCGARLEAAAGRVLVVREAGEFVRRPLTRLTLTPGIEAVWDGRWAFAAAEPGWSVVPAAGRLATLSRSDRAVLDALPPAARAAWPVLIRDAATAPVLAAPAVSARSLVEERLALALDRMTHESQLGPRTHGALPRNHLFSGADITE